MIDNRGDPAKRTSGLSLYAGFVPVLLLIIIIAVLHFASPSHPFARTVFEPPFLLPILNTIFLFLAPCIVAYMAMRSYFVGGSSTVLFLGCGVLTLGTGNLLAGWLIGPEGPNATVTLSNTSMLLASAFFMAGAITNVMDAPLATDPVNQRRYLASGYLGVLAVVLLTALAAVRDITPPFFVQGVGPTLLRQLIVMIAIFLFVISSSSMMVRFADKRMRFLYWCSLALALLAVGFGGIFLQPAVGSPMGWIGRIAQYLAGIYFIIAVVSAKREAITQGIAVDDVITDIFRQSERKITAILDSMTDCHYELDREWRFTRINDRALAYFNKRREDFIGRTYWDAFTVPKGSTFEEHFRRALLESVPVHFELESVVVPGKWAEMHAYPTGQGLSVYFRDITDRKQSEDAVRESERHYRLLFETMSQGVVYQDTDGTIISMNLPAQRILGKTAPGFIGSSSVMAEQHTVREDGSPFPGLEHPSMVALRTGREVRDVTMGVYNPAENNYRWIRIGAVPLFREGEEKPYQVYTVFDDITERKKTEEALRDSERLYRAIGESIDYGVWVCAPDGRNIYASESFLKMVGITQEQCSNFGWGDVLHPDDAERTIAAWKECVETGETWDIEHRFRGVDGQWHPVLARGNPVKNERGEIVCWAGINLDISRIKQAEAALRESEKHYRSLFNNMLNGYAYCRMVFEQGRPKDFIYLDVNGMFEAMTGLKDVVGKTVSEVIPGIQEAEPDLLEIYGRVALTGKPERFEKYIQSLGMWFSVSVYSPQKEHFVTVFDAINERKRAEEALQTALQRFYTVLSSMYIAVVLATDENRVEFVNQALCDYFGFKEPPEDFVGLASSDLVTKMKDQYLYPDEAVARLKEIVNQRQPVRSEEVAMRDGHVHLRDFVPIRIDGKPYGRLWYHTDITDRKKAEELLKRNVERLDIISSTASQLLMSKEPQKIVETLCKRVMEHLDCHVFFNFLVHDEGKRLQLNAYAGIPDETARRIHFLDYGVAVCGCAAQDACRIVAENIPTTPDIRTELVRSFGIKAYACHPLLARDRVIGTLSFGTRSRLTFTEDDLSLMKTVADQVATAMEGVRLLRVAEERADELEIRVQERTVELSQAYESLQHEVEERQRTEEQLRQSQKMEAIGTLAGGIAHDFNNIIASILGFTEMALDDVPDRPLVERNLRNVLKSSMRARDLVKQILAFSRKSNYERSPLSLTSVLGETVQLLRASIPKTIDIRLSTSATSDAVLAAPVEVSQILMNLVTNASLAMQEKGGTVEISLTDIDFEPESPVLQADVAPGEYVQLMVNDTGVGMSHEVMKRVFEPFFTTREVGKGTGMGLAVVYGIVKDLQGMITVESEPGVGSTFRVLLPKLKAQAEGKLVRTGQIHGGKESILFVDDEEMLVEWGKAVLERLGYSVTALTDSREALKVFSSDPSRFDLIVTDQTMSGMTGVQLTKELLSIRPDIPVILCTGHSETVSPDIAREVGIREYLMKPVAKQELAEAVRRVLDAVGGTTGVSE